MARALLLTFKDNDAAEAFVKLILASDNIQKDDADGWRAHVTELGVLASAYSKVEWMVAQPTVWCKCRIGRGRSRGWTKTKKFGWFVHDQCNRVSYYVVRDFVKNHRQGEHDLIPGLITQRKSDIHIMPNTEHIVAGCPAHHDHTNNILEVDNVQTATEQPDSANGSSSDPANRILHIVGESYRLERGSL